MQCLERTIPLEAPLFFMVKYEKDDFFIREI